MEKIKKNMCQKEFEKAKTLITWNKFFMSTLGLWPNKQNDFIFICLFSYFCYQFVLDFISLYLTIKSFNLMKIIVTAIENLTLIQIFIRLYTIRRYNKSYGEIFEEFFKDFSIEKYCSKEEQTVFLNYNSHSKVLIKTVVISLGLTAIIYFMKPLIRQLNFSRNSNSIIIFTYDLPYRMHIFYKITNTKIYALTYFSQILIFYIIIFTQTAMDCLTLSLISHLCGQLAVLSVRIRNLDFRNGTQELKNIIQKHENLIKIGIKIIKIYRVCLFAHFMGASIGICILVYKVLLSILVGQKTNLVAFFSYGFLNIFRLYTHCWVGEYLIYESINISNAFYQCQWYNLGPNDQKSILICITRSQKSLSLVAGYFGNYSLTMFTNVMKSAIAYLSFLRNFI